MADSPTFNWVQSTGNISVEPVPPHIRIPSASYIFLIIGPTGSGKSSFIEALAGKPPDLSISKDQLAGYTQNVTAYRLVNVHRSEWPIYLVDTPGFSDTRISEFEIMHMVRNWLLDNALQYVHRILFLTPITDARLGGSKRRTIGMIRAFLTQSNDLGSVTFVTTMWDKLHSERSRLRAASVYAELRDGVFKEFIAQGAELTKFTNTRSTGLPIIISPLRLIHTFTKDDTPRALHSPHIYQDLHERIEGALQRRKTIESELADPEAQSNPLLNSILHDHYTENEVTLTKFIGQLSTLTEAPAGYEHAARGLRRTIAAEVVPMDAHHEEVFRLWAGEAECSGDTRLGGQLLQIPSMSSLRRVVVAATSRGVKWFKDSALDPA